MEVLGDSLVPMVKAVERITTVFPTTTATALTTLFTGLPPGIHGVVGNNVYLRELGMVVNTLNMSPVIGERDLLVKVGHDLRRLFPIGSTLFEELGKVGVKSRVYVPRGLGNGLSRLIYAGSEIHEYASFYEALVDSLRFLKRHGRAFAHVYIPTIDEVMHRHGPSSEEANVTIAEVLGSVVRIVKKYGNGHTVIITSDHGHRDIVENVDARKYPRLLGLLEVPPHGDARAVYLRLKRGVDPREALDIVTNELGPYAVLDREGLREVGLLGELSDEALERVGDLVVIPPSDKSLIYPFRPEDDRVLRLKGQHGGLSPSEVYVPLIQVS